MYRQYDHQQHLIFSFLSGIHFSLPSLLISMTRTFSVTYSESVEKEHPLEGTYSPLDIISSVGFKFLVDILCQVEDVPF